MWPLPWLEWQRIIYVLDPEALFRLFVRFLQFQMGCTTNSSSKTKRVPKTHSAQCATYSQEEHVFQISSSNKAQSSQNEGFRTHEHFMEDTLNIEAVNWAIIKAKIMHVQVQAILEGLVSNKRRFIVSCDKLQILLNENRRISKPIKRT